MGFVNRGYESDAGFVCLIRQSDAEAAASGGSGGTADAPFHCYSSGKRSRFGIHARGVRLSRTVGTAPNQFTKSSFLAYPTKAAWEAASVGGTVTIGSVAWTITGKLAEAAV